MGKFFKKHKVLFNPGILKQEYNHIRYGKLYWIKYCTDKEFRLKEQMKRKALDNWDNEINEEISRVLFSEERI